MFHDYSPSKQTAVVGDRDLSASNLNDIIVKIRELKCLFTFVLEDNIYIKIPNVRTLL